MKENGMHKAVEKRGANLITKGKDGVYILLRKPQKLRFLHEQLLTIKLLGPLEKIEY